MAGPKTRKRKQATPVRTKPKKAARRWWRILLWWIFEIGVWCTLALMIVFALFAYSVDEELREKFENPRWKLPSHIYSDSMWIYPGRLLSTSGLIERLKQLNYQETTDEPTRPGEYRLTPNEVLIYQKKFEYPGETVAARLVRVSLGGEAIVQLFDITNKTPLDVLRIEPMKIGSIFPQFQIERRIIPYDELPASLVWSVVAIEDSSFFDHHGINFRGIARAFFKGLAQFEFSEGGSSITQQLVKNLYLKPEHTFRRKLIEAAMALTLEMHYPKEKIFEVYINEIYFGQLGGVSICGVGEAANFYFGKRGEDLSLSEAALLAGLIRSPAVYNPRNKDAVERARNRRDYILDRLADNPRAKRELGVEELDLELAKNQEVQDSVIKIYISPESIGPYFIMFLTEQLRKAYGEEVLQSQGLRIFTTLDVTTQLMAEQAVREALEELETNNVKLRAEDDNKLQAAMVVLEPSTGAVRAMVGGRSFRQTQLNRAVQMRRQVGSVFKPVVYTAAFLRAYHDRDFHFSGATMLKDEPWFLEVAGQPPWKPGNSDRKFEGGITVRRALEGSRNVPTARLAVEIGIDRVLETAKLLLDLEGTPDQGENGKGPKLPAVPSLALGVAEMSPMDVATMFGTIANEGQYNEPITIRDVVDREGNVLQKARLKTKQKLPPEVAYQVTSLLEGVVDYGTAQNVRRWGLKIPCAGKTGTTDDKKDAWFVGYTPQILAAVWVGFDRERRVGLYGAQAALPIWLKFMIAFTRDGAGEPFEPPPGIVFRNICQETGLLAHAESRKIRREAFLEGTEPREESDVNRDAVIDYFKTVEP